MLTNLLINLYILVHGKLHLPGAGWLIRRFRSVVPGLHAYPFQIPEVGTAVLDFRDDAAFGMLNYVLGDYGDDAQLLSFLKRFLKPGHVFWDIGANIGYLTMYFAKPSHQLAAIHAFEPNPDAFKGLLSLFQNHSAVRVHNIGLGRTDGRINMNVLRGGSKLSSLACNLKNGEKVEIQIWRGDSYREEHKVPLPDVIKIDVEGFEPQVIEGLSETIRLKRPVIILEHIFHSDEQLKLLLPDGYLMHFIMEDGSLTADFSDRMKGFNALLRPKELADLRDPKH